MTDFSIEPKTTALILIDLQHAIVARKTAPYSSEDVVRNCAKLAARFRAKGATVVYVRVDLANILKLQVDKPRDGSTPTPNGSDIVPEAGMVTGDILITKRQWGAFFGTDLEQQLHTRHVKTVVLGGIATNYGVESTARAAAGLGFALITVENATSSLDKDAHEFAYKNIFPLIGRVRSTEEVLQALA